MNSFYVSMIFIGIILIVASLIWVAFEKKSSYSFMKKMEEKKQDMVSIINDAEQMIDELNKFSDYIVTQMDVKNEELRANLNAADEEIKQLRSQISEYKTELPGKAAMIKENAPNKEAAADINYAAEVSKTAEISKTSAQAKVVNGSSLKPQKCPPEKFIAQNTDLVIESSTVEQALSKKLQSAKQYTKRNDKIIPIDSRHKEVLRLSSDGLSDTEIARRLNMGKGEIQLILEINKP